MAHGHDKGHLHSTRTRQQHTPGFTFHSSWQGPAGSSPTQRSNGDTNPTGKNGHTSSTNSAAPPVPWQQLHTTITTLQHLNASNGQPAPPAEQAAAERIATTGAQTPHGSHVHLNWAIAQVSYPSGYLPATAQETLLQAYLGTQGASTATTLAQRWGRSGQHL